MSTPDPYHPQQPGAPGPHPNQPPNHAELDGAAPPGYQMQPGWVLQAQPQLPPPDLDEHLKRITPYVWVTYVLAAINAIVFIVMLARGVSPMTPTVADLINWGGSLTALNFGGEPWRILTACFVHLGIIHIGVNLFSLLSIGPRAERMVGPWGFLIAYLISGLVGSLVSSTWNSNVVSVGASGAIFGIIGLQLTILLTHPESSLQESLKSAWSGILTIVGVNLLIGFTTPGIDNASHISGLVAGGLCGLVLSQPIDEKSVENRWLRDACLAVVGVLLVGGGYFGAASFASATVEWNLAWEKFAEEEQKIVEIYQKAHVRAGQNELSHPELAAFIESDSLPPFRAIAEKLHATKEPNGRLGKFRSMALKYADSRQRAWEMEVDFLKESDPAEKAAKAERVNAEVKSFQANFTALKDFFNQ